LISETHVFLLPLFILPLLLLFLFLHLSYHQKHWKEYLRNTGLTEDDNTILIIEIINTEHSHGENKCQETLSKCLPASKHYHLDSN
jgi:hypothetical protein